MEIDPNMPKIQTITATTRSHTLVLGGIDLVCLLRLHYGDIPITASVQTGLGTEITMDDPVTVRWTEVVEDPPPPATPPGDEDIPF